MTEFERYIFRRMALLTFWALIAATPLVLTTQVLLRLNVLTSSNEALVALLKISAFLLPSMLVVVAPFALLIGVTQVLNGMNSDSELVVMEASGAGPAIIFRPILALAMLVSLMVFAVSNFVEAPSNRAFGDTLESASADLLSVAVQRGTFQKLDEGLYVHIDTAYPGGEFGGIFLSDDRAEDREMVYFAQRGRMVELNQDRFMVLVDGQAQQRDKDSGRVSIVSFDTYALDLSSFLPSNERSIYRPREQSTLYLLNPPADDFFVQNYPADLEKELIERLTNWMYPLAIGLIAYVWLGKARSNRQDQLQSIIIVVGGSILLRGFGFFSAEEAANSFAIKIAAYGVPIATIAIYFLFAVTGTVPRSPKWLRARSDALSHRISLIYGQIQAWYLRRARRGADRA